MSMTASLATPVAARPPLRPRTALTAVGNEVVKGLRQAWAERVQILIELPMFVAFALMMAFLLGRGEQVAATGQLEWTLDPAVTSWFLMGFVAFTFFYLQVVKVFWRLLAEIQSGTLEQVYLSPLPPWIITAVGRATATVIETALVVTPLFLITGLATDLDLTLRADALLPLVLLMIGTVGYSLVIAGLTLVWKRVEMVNEGLLLVVMGGSGGVLPFDRLPDWVATVGRFMPITDGIAGLRRTLLAGEPLAAWGIGGVVPALVNAAGWVLVGALFFVAAEHVAKRRGSLSHH